MIDNELQQKRLIAAVIDIGILVVLGVATSAFGYVLSCSGALGRFGFLGTYAWSLLGIAYALAGPVYILGRDVFAGDRSLGKKLVNIRIETAGRTRVTPLDSAKRNAIFSLGFLLFFLALLIDLIPVLGWIISCFVRLLGVLASLFTVAAVVYELVLIMQDPAGIRLGDKFAGTRVVK